MPFKAGLTLSLFAFFTTFSCLGARYHPDYVCQIGLNQNGKVQCNHPNTTHPLHSWNEPTALKECTVVANLLMKADGNKRQVCKVGRYQGEYLCQVSQKDTCTQHKLTYVLTGKQAPKRSKAAWQKCQKLAEQSGLFACDVYRTARP